MPLPSGLGVNRYIMQTQYYSNGKLLITGEYVVLDGATALSLPTKFGQDLVVSPGVNQQIEWISKDHDGSVWYEGTIGFSEIINKKQNAEASVENVLLNILHQAYLLNPSFIEQSNGYTVVTNLTFPKFWGLGTSSTLINNVAQWLNIDAFTLLKNSFGGSGYDIASAQHNSAILYELREDQPKVIPLTFKPEFANQLYFVYLNKKQSSKGAIASYYNNKPANSAQLISEVNKLTACVVAASNLHNFEIALRKHENLLSSVLEMQTVQELYFSDFDGVVKSLGAWGGDFVLATSKNDPTMYFENKGFTTVVPYHEMIL